jgi:hypothetical protein
VVASECLPGTSVVVLPSGLVITPWHPIRVHPTAPWQFPVDVPHARTSVAHVVVDGVGAASSFATPTSVFSVLLDAPPTDELLHGRGSQGVSLFVQGTECAVLGHGVTTPGCILPHAFYGTRQVETALSKFPGWTQGAHLHALGFCVCEKFAAHGLI